MWKKLSVKKFRALIGLHGERNARLRGPKTGPANDGHSKMPYGQEATAAAAIKQPKNSRPIRPPATSKQAAMSDSRRG